MLNEAHVIWINEGRTNGHLKEIVLDESPFLQAQFGRPLKTYPVKIGKVPGKKGNTYDYTISCPVCGKFTIEGYKGIPKEVDVYVGSDRGGKFAVFDFNPEGSQSKSDQVASEIMINKLTKGSG